MLFIGGNIEMATKTKKVTKAVKATAEKMVDAVEAVEEKAEKVIDIVEDKVSETVVEAKEEVKEVVEKVKKATAKKDIKTTLIVEYCGKQVEDKAIIAAVKKAWTKAGHKVGEIKSMELYVKPEDAAVYYVINKTETGKVEF